MEDTIGVDARADLFREAREWFGLCGKEKVYGSMAGKLLKEFGDAAIALEVLRHAAAAGKVRDPAPYLITVAKKERQKLTEQEQEKNAMYEAMLNSERRWLSRPH